MIDGLVPSAVRAAETFTDAPESMMLAEEAAYIAGAVDARRREFCTVRCCARVALGQIGIAAAPILPDESRAPRWPVGTVGSMTHCRGYRAAAVAPSSELRAIGIDAEHDAPVPPDALELVLGADERAHVRALAHSDPETNWDRLAFAAKEAAYKAWFPVTRQWLDFSDLSVRLRPGGTFTARVGAGDPPVAGTGMDRLAGHWTVGNSLIVTAIAIR